VVGQVALAFTLLVASGLLLRSFRTLAELSPGFEAGNTLAVDLLLPPGRYPDRAAASGFMRTLEARVEALPGVLEALSGYDPPTQGTWMERFTIVGDPPPAPGEALGGYFRPVSPGWFETFSIPVVAGRSFDESDGLDGVPTVIVNETWVRTQMPDRNPLGARIVMSTVRNNWSEEAPVEWEIVGVVSDVRFRGLREQPGAALYFSSRQAPTSFARFMVRTAGDPEAILPSLRQVLDELDPRLPISGATTLEGELRAATAQDRFNALLLIAFAVAALFVASAGLYGVLAYAVARRRTEVGVRMAMGAAPSRVWRMLVLEGLVLAGGGLLGGLGLSLLAGGALGSVLYGVSPRDPGVLATVIAVLATAALLAAAVPATRAARAHPAAALQSD
jgi:predicted permease